MSGREDTLRRLAEANPGRSFVYINQLIVHGKDRRDDPALQTHTLSVIPGFDGSQCQLIQGDDFLVCVSRCREAIEKADREAYERDMAEGNDIPPAVQISDCK